MFLNGDFMRLTIATNNDNKLIEIKELLKEFNIEIRTLKDLNIKDINEPGETFLENSVIKALEVSKIVGGYVLADDSGLMIEALNNRPGIYSKRYSGKGDYENNLKVLEELKGVTNRNAMFVTVLALAKDGKLINTYEGLFKGTIDDKLSGDNLFGYDPIFIPEGYNISAASLSLEVKNKISHRAKALRLFIDDFKNLLLK